MCGGTGPGHPSADRRCSAQCGYYHALTVSLQGKNIDKFNENSQLLRQAQTETSPSSTPPLTFYPPAVGRGPSFNFGIN